MTKNETTNTPGFNTRVEVRFSHDKNGRKMAHAWAPRARRWMKVGLVDAEMWVAQDLADRFNG